MYDTFSEINCEIGGHLGFFPCTHIIMVSHAEYCVHLIP